MYTIFDNKKTRYIKDKLKRAVKTLGILYKIDPIGLAKKYIKRRGIRKRT